ncbi:DUF5615 family PIN-like protein [Jiangella asiatica]|uniref:DUF5615 domain-containing protein n=1 Tax=Jiangella asiatica TaxID=2530372 RepID=A0A4R5CNY8_9ACTN|nr:DUF5615 family PIN-like protein [Jiangella asiatica]TDE01796.1 hypothetical protein E1269_22570 [Jiangella asiatica]
MKFLLDENISHRLCPSLKAAGHDAVHVSEIGLASTDDSVIVARALADGSVVVSCDHDFVQLLYASGASMPSLLLTREVDTLTSTELAELICPRCRASSRNSWMPGPIATLTPDRVRVRPLPLRPITSGTTR